MQSIVRPVEAVLLDAGGVLVLPHHEVLAVHALGPLGIVPEPEELDRAHYVGGHALQVWPDDEETIFAKWNRAYLEHLGVEANPESMRLLKGAFQRLDMWTRPAPGVHDGLAAIAGTGARLAVVSNADGQAEEMLRDIGVCQVGMGRGTPVDAVIDSTVVGVAKPDPRIFHIALERLGVAPERAVHVGDLIGADVVGARTAGVRPLHFDPIGICTADDHEHVANLTDVAELVAASRPRS
ncbi:MAG: HAD family hydrolase [Actinobacteria bacterium]|nr:HAD family hydrolase [Actinomycetota bacterium]